MSERSLRIAVADDEPVMQLYLEETLTEFGHEIVGVAGDGRQLLRQWQAEPADLIITDIKMPDMDGLTAVREIYRERAVPVVLVTGYNSLEAVGFDEVDFVLAFLVKPIGENELRTAIRTVMSRYREFELLLEESGSVTEALQSRRTVERAKELLMGRQALNEEEAFELLQKKVAEGCSGLLDAANDVVRKSGHA